MQHPEFQVGDIVSFGVGRGEQTLGKIIKINRVRAKVKLLEARRSSKKHWPVGAIFSVGYGYMKLSDLDPHDKPEPKKPVLKSGHRKEQEILEDFQKIECAVSPENLYCDGELSKRQAQAKYARLMRQRKALVKELGREPTTEEIWGVRFHD